MTSGRAASFAPRLVLILCTLFLAAAVVLSAGAQAPGAAPLHWVGAWEAPASDASLGSGISDIYDTSGHPKTPVSNATVRAILTPSVGSEALRVRLSNRFGAGPVTFERATVARRESGAALVPGTVRGLTFRGLRSATVAPGDDVVSDPVQLNFGAYRKSLAVSVYVPSNVGKPTEHYTARQTSYLTPEGAGDKTSDLSGSPFTEETTTRPFVIGIDVRRQPGFGGVVTLGDSFTDGYQGRPTGPLEAQEGIDADGRWPDVLGRRLRAADIPLSVMNAGISGNRVLRDGEEGGNLDTYGPSALHRLRHDVLRQPGVTTVILLEGGNDLGLEPNATVAELEAGYRELIRRMHVAGLHVLQGTLTPMVGGMGDYGTAEANRKRNRINSWIRNESPAEGVIDVARVVRDPNDASRIRPAYDSGDHLHLNLAGYRAVGQAVPLGQLR